MTDLTNVWPSWGQNGELPPVGFFYEGGDRVNEKHLDALWDSLHDEWNELIAGITNRVSDLHGNVALNSGLVASDGGSTDVNISASTAGAYVDGQKLDSVSADTVSLAADGTARTDTIQLAANGTLTANYNSTSADANKMKIAEVDVTVGNDISAIRQHTNRLTDIRAQEAEPSAPATGSGIWYDSDAGKYKVYDSGWGPLATESWTNTNFYDKSEADGRYVNETGDTMSGTLDLGGNDLESGSTTIWDESASYIPQGRLQNDNVTVAGNSVSLGGSTGINFGDLGGSLNLGGDKIFNVDAIELNNIEFSELNANELGYDQSDGLAYDDGSTTVRFYDNNANRPALGDLSNVSASGEGSGNNFDADTVDGRHANDIDGFVETAPNHLDLDASLPNNTWVSLYSNASGVKVLSATFYSREQNDKGQQTDIRITFGDSTQLTYQAPYNNISGDSINISAIAGLKDVTEIEARGDTDMSIDAEIIYA
ncbi:hypothetical protein M1M34_gp030 [Haloarcula tailed virus 2]|uniref:Uncharacterized protein n=1 Tax=Haloarcula tailed virus 2 TaxID=2877989 RepID=A0AAE8Y0K4_9CAUD|nr:hypothetical protein M1M34_gp030 [Haloarcula tailed virus 2]UBF23181.1 hypothetical protein HATV-2_gp30 [Haloarcula tailed virus 2]